VQLTPTHLKRLFALFVATFALATVAAMAPASAEAGSRAGHAGTDSAAVGGSDAGVLTLAPPCVRVSTRQEGLTKYEDVRNLCGQAYRVKVIVAWGPDSPCHHLDPGEGFTHTHGIAGSFDRLDLC
jgi:Alpha amylase inhibitor